MALFSSSEQSRNHNKRIPYFANKFTARFYFYLMLFVDMYKKCTTYRSICTYKLDLNPILIFAITYIIIIKYTAPLNIALGPFKTSGSHFYVQKLMSVNYRNVIGLCQV